MKIDYKVAFRVLGFETSPDDVSRILRINPTSTWKKGDRRHSKATIVHQENGWEFASSAPAQVPIAVQLGTLILQLESSCKSIAAIEGVKNFNCMVSIYGDGRPELSLDSKLVLAIAQLNAGIDFDLIFYPED